MNPDKIIENVSLYIKKTSYLIPSYVPHVLFFTVLFTMLTFKIPMYFKMKACYYI